MRIRVLWEGKTKQPHLRALVEDYAARLAKFGDFAIEEIPEAKKPRTIPIGTAAANNGKEQKVIDAQAA